MSRLIPLIALLLLPGPLHACMWDRDTLAAEAKGLPETVAVITGRFERNPPLYYQMRLERAAAAIQANPDQLDAYDDAGVACDRLGRSSEAIRWMDRKRQQLDRTAAPPQTRREHRYRYLANAGTFWAHRWLRDGADRRRLREVKTARDFIKQAIELNPDAHFGREKYQLRALEWIISPPDYWRRDERLANFLELEPSYRVTDDSRDLVKQGYGDAVRGLSGLIVLGNAWDSVDIFHSLSLALKAEGRSSVAYLARLRCWELIDAGRRSLLSGAPTGEELKEQVGPSGSAVRSLESLTAEYRKLCKEAETWHARRTAYMMTRLQAGRHPDTDPTFWNGYSDPGPPRLSNYRPEQWLMLQLALFIVGLIVGIFLLRRLWKRYHFVFR